MRSHNHPHASLFAANKCQVRALNVCEDYVFAGTTWSCLVVIDKTSMLPVCCLNCHADESPYVKAVLPLMSLRSAVETNSESPGKSPSLTPQEHPLCSPTQRLPIIVTIGKGHKDVIGKHIPRHELRWDSSPKNTTYMLSWEARHWKHTGQMTFLNH